MKQTIKAYIKKNLMVLILLFGSLLLYVCVPGQIAENMVAKAAVSPRFFPTFAVVSVMLCSALLLVFDARERITAARRGEGPKAEERNGEVSYPRVALVIALLFAWYLLMPRVGFILSTVAAMCVMSYLLGCRNKVILVVFPLVFTLAVYFAFVELLHVSLPEILF